MSELNLSIVPLDEFNPAASYHALKERFEQLKLAYENQRQEAHTMSLKLQIATKTNSELSYEMAAVVDENDALLSKQKQQSQQQNAEIKKLQSDIEQLLAEKAELQQYIETLSERLMKSESASSSETVTVTIAEPNDSFQELDQVTKLKAKLTDTEMKLLLLQQASIVTSDECESLKQQCGALQSNYANAKQEIQELQNLLEAAQEHVSSLSAEIHGLRCNPDGNKKGNSLFAEVDDQRKELINIIKRNNARYYALKAEHQTCPQRTQRLHSELLNIQCRLKIYEDSVGCADESYVKAIQQLNGHITEELQKTIDRNNFLQQQLAKNSDAWVKLMVKFNMEEQNALRSRLMTCLLKHRMAEDEHLYRAKELDHVRMEVVQLKLKLCNELEGVKSLLTNSNLNLEQPACSLKNAAVAASTAGGEDIDSGVPPAEASINVGEDSSQEQPENTPVEVKPTDDDSQTDQKIGQGNITKRIQLKKEEYTEIIPRGANTIIAHSTAAKSIDSGVPAAEASIKVCEEEKPENKPIEAKPTDDESQTGRKKGLNIIVKRIQLKKTPVMPSS